MVSNFFANGLQFLSVLNVLSKSTFKSASSVLSDLRSNFARLNDCSRVPSCLVRYSEMSVSVASGLSQSYKSDVDLPEV